MPGAVTRQEQPYGNNCRVSSADAGCLPAPGTILYKGRYIVQDIP